MDEDHRYHAVSKAILVACGLVMGVFYCLLTVRLRSAMEAAESFPGMGIVAMQAKASPHALFFLVSLAFGWAAAWLAERRGLISWVPLLAIGAIAIAVGFGLSAVVGAPLPRTTRIAFFVAALGFMAAGSLRQKMAS